MLKNTEQFLTFIESGQLTTNIKRYSFKPTDDRNLSFIPGQYLELLFTSERGQQSRFYSIASAPEEPTIDIAVRSVKNGFADGLLKNLTYGQTLRFNGPMGNSYISRWDNCTHMLVGTGVGVAPFRSMLNLIASNIEEESSKVIVLVGANNREDVPFTDEFMNLATRLRNFEFKICLDPANKVRLNSWETSETLEQTLMDCVHQTLPAKVILSSSPMMVEKLRKKLFSIGVSPETIVSDL